MGKPRRILKLMFIRLWISLCISCTEEMKFVSSVKYHDKYLYTTIYVPCVFLKFFINGNRWTANLYFSRCDSKSLNRELFWSLCEFCARFATLPDYSETSYIEGFETLRNSSTNGNFRIGSERKERDERKLLNCEKFDMYIRIGQRHAVNFHRRSLRPG